MNGFSDPIFWGLYGVSLLGVVLWVLFSKLDVTDKRIVGGPLEVLKVHWLTFLFALVSDFIVCIALWEGIPEFGVPPMRHLVWYALCGFCAPGIVMKLLGATLGRIHAKPAEGDK